MKENVATGLTKERGCSANILNITTSRTITTGLSMLGLGPLGIGKHTE